MRILESSLEWIQLTSRRGQALDGLDVMAVGLRRQHDARPRRFVVEEDGAGTANAVLTTNVCAGETEVLAEKVAQQ
jgi:hypothetical protein